MNRRDFLKTSFATALAAACPAVLAASEVEPFLHPVVLRHAIQMEHVAGQEQREVDLLITELKRWLKNCGIKPGTRFVICGPEYEDFDFLIGMGVALGPDIDRRYTSPRYQSSTYWG